VPPRPPGRPMSFWVAILLFFLLGGSAVLNLVLAVATVASTTKENDERAFQEAHLDGDLHQSDRVLDVALTGVITDNEGSEGLSSRRDPVSTIRAQLRQAQKDPRVRAILLEVNSPGGGLTASDLIYHELQTFRKERKIPVVVLFDDVAASGGYYVAMASDHIVAHQTTLCGSIGVIAQFPDVHALLSKIGVQMNTIKSQRFNGNESMKDIGSPYRGMKPAERQLWQSMINQMWQRFVDVVVEGRSGKMTAQEVRQVADGRIFTAQQALDRKMIDSIGYRNDAWQRAARLAHVPSAQLVQYYRHTSLFHELFATRASSASMEAALKRYLDPLTVSSPRLMYLWRP
jgi:protease IV